MAEGSKVRIYGDPVLRDRAEQVEVFDAALADLVARMTEAMIDDFGVGLAAPQIGVKQRVVVIDRHYGEGEPDVFALVNPEIVAESGSCTFEEGCLSIPGIWAEVVRPASVEVRYQTPDGEQIELVADGYLARIIQHEVDHLEGVLFVDRLNTVTRDLLAKDLRELADKQRES